MALQERYEALSDPASKRKIYFESSDVSKEQYSTKIRKLIHLIFFFFFFFFAVQAKINGLGISESWVNPGNSLE